MQSTEAVIKRDKGGHILCPHGRQRDRCQPCGGRAICEHGKIQAYCQDCGGSQICKHGRSRYGCKNCNPLGAYKKCAAGAKRRGHRFEISFEEYQAIVNHPCHYCGASDETSGMDQVIAGEGYTLSNCAPCCSDCNEMKNDRSVEAFVQHAARITVFQRKHRSAAAQ